MITIQADFNHRDEHGHLVLADLAMHRGTPFASIAARSPEVTFVDGEDKVPGELIAEGTDGWIGVVDWTRLETVEAWPEAATTGIREGQ